MDGDGGGESGKIPLDVALLAGALLAMLCCWAADVDPYQAYKERLWYRYGVVVRLLLQSGNAADEAVQGILLVRIQPRLCWFGDAKCIVKNNVLLLDSPITPPRTSNTLSRSLL